MQLGPLVFIPKLSKKIWGGQRLKSFGKVFSQDQAIGESWDIYDRPGDSALVAQGPFQGQTLNALMNEFGPQLLGVKAFEQGASYFPLMVKLIDANDALSVQVHPDDAQAARMVSADELGKTEMWVVLEASPGAVMTAGLVGGTTFQVFLDAVKQGRLEKVLNEFPVKAGDVVFVPAGRVHAIGKGCLVAEIQQNSDTTWRVHDYGRLEQGKARELHLSQALECIRFDKEIQGLPSLVVPWPVGPSEEGLVQCPYFRVSRLTLSGRFSPGPEAPSYHLLSVIQGRIRVHAGAELLELGLGSTALIPACLTWFLEPLTPLAQALWTRP